MSADLLASMLRAVLAASAAMLVVLSLRTALRQVFGARIAYALWLLVPIVTLAGFLPARRVFVDAATAHEAPALSASVQPAAIVDAAPPLPIDVLPINFDITPLVLLLWLIGSVVSVALLALGQHRFLSRLGLRRAADGVHIADGDVAGPAVIGVVAPRIIVPADFHARYTDLERTLMLEHERAHIRAGDVQINALAAFVQCAMWFNPLVYIARAALRVDQELACDERVMQRFASARRAYAEAMLKTQLAARAIPLGCAWPPLGAGPLKQRIAMLGRPRVAGSRRALGAGLCAVVVLTAGVAAWAAQPPRAYAQGERSSDWLGAGGARLVQALMDGDVAQARTLIAQGADVNHWTPGDGTPLIMAIRLNDTAMAGDLIAAGADVNKAARGEGNALIVASARGNLALVRMFVEAGADVNAIVPADETPLINAAWNGNVDVARYLIERGADPNLSVRAPVVDGSELRSPLIMARRGNHTEMIALLTAAGARD